VAAALALSVAPARVEAAPDIDGAVDALISLPYDAFGNAFGAMGLLVGSVGGVAGDIVAVIDNNEYSSILLRGLLSTPIKRLSSSISQLSTGAMEGMRDQDFNDFPQAGSVYTGSDGITKHFSTFGHGLGATGLIVVDTLGNTGRFLTHLVGLNDMANDMSGWQDGMRDDWVGKASAGAAVEKTMLFE
jgi:hypothetical protein